LLARGREQSKSGLNLKIDESGTNLSVGEKQLICICRAILRRNKIIILDEATANIDVVTEQKILSLINSEFSDASVITIAHRINTIMKSDKVLVLDAGRLIEYDAPSKLLSDPTSHFSSLLKELKAKP
jgi:ABC-type multidrug transport system fused ATPase/permease subunit